MYELPMFPLEQTVLPTAVVPLHVFEPRYRVFAAEVTARADPEFGITPIERGREVGGDDVRSDVGVVARVVQSEEFADGRWALVSVATRRIRVREWLSDDPYPRAMVEDWPDDDLAGYLAQIERADVSTLTATITRVRDAAQRLQPDRPMPEVALADDPAHATWQAIVFAQLNAFDAASLLRAGGAGERLDLANRLILERAEVLEALADERG